MIRTVITPDQQNISINLPENFVGKQVEVIAFTLDDTIDHPNIFDQVQTHIASEKVLAKEWLSPEEDSAWQHL